MTAEDIKSVAASIAQRLGSYPMLITIILLVGALIWIVWNDKRETTVSLQRLVFDQLGWERSQIEYLQGEILECYKRHESRENK